MSETILNSNERLSRLQVIWFFIKPYKIQILVLFILFLLVGTLEAATIAAIYPILDAAFSSSIGEGNVILSVFDSFAKLLPISDLFISYCTVFMLLAVLTFLVKFAGITFRTRIIAHIVAEKQDEIFRKFMRADFQVFIENKQGELLYNTINAPMQLSLLISSVTELFSQALLSISVFVLLFSLSWAGALGTLVMGLAYIFISRYLGDRVSYHAMQAEMEAIRESNVLFNEGINGIKQIKVFAMAELWGDRFGQSVMKRWVNYKRRSVWQQVPPVALILVLYLAVALVVLLIKLVTPSGYIELVPVFGAFAFAVFRLIPFVSSIGNTTMQIIASLPDCEVMYRLLTTNLSTITSGDIDMGQFSSDVSFRNVSFAYKERSETLLDFSAIFKKGETTAIVGRSGSGKSTILNLLLRLFDVEEGEISVDGRNIKEYTLETWLKHIGYVSQDTFILNDTIENNITFGSDYYSREQVARAAAYADAHGFISEMPEGYDTMVGDKGMRLSGGQAQRIAVARAMIREPEILIFDEATNNLDTISEMAVQKAIEEISKDHTVILIAHRLSTIVNADKILVIERGKLIEEGKHRELLELKGAYWRLYQRQGE